MSEKHTPSPWVARKDPNGGLSDWCVGIEADNVPIDYVAVCWERDARLIAAAPELLEALIAIRDRNHTGDAWALVNAAISKATGGAK